MRYMVIVKTDETIEGGATADTEMFEAMGNYNQRLIDAGVMVSGEGLLPSSKGFKLKFDGKERTVTDGPFAEAKELIGGFWILQTSTREELIDWLKQAPFDGGTELEIRQIGELDDYGEAFTPELQEQEARQRATLEARQKQ